jgi:glycosyltransferase 2 family protein
MDSWSGRPPAGARWRWIGTAASLLIIVASVGVLWFLIEEVQLSDITQALANVSRRQLWMAAGFTCISYACLSLYDAFALRGLGLRVGLPTSMLGSFTSYAVSFTLGFPVVTAGAVRYGVYAPYGLRGSEIARVTLVAGITFWLGMALVLGAMLPWAAGDLARVARSHPWVMQVLGGALLAGLVAYLAFVTGGHRSVAIRGWTLPLPGLRLTLVQLVLGVVDVCAGAAVLYLLLPSGHGLAYETFLAVYVFAAIVGIASHAPGGLGAFEATMLIAIKQVPSGQLLGALLLFRLIYYIAPFLIALAMLGLYEILRRIRRGP